MIKANEPQIETESVSDAGDISGIIPLDLDLSGTY